MRQHHPWCILAFDSKMPVLKEMNPLDRAMLYREEGLYRMQLKSIGFQQNNRGGIGIAPVHVHEVAWSCLDKIKWEKYKQMEVVRVPSKHLDEWRAINMEKCQSDALMPQFSPSMTVAALTKIICPMQLNCLKMATDHYSTKVRKKPLVLKPDDKEGRLIVQGEGIVCCVYSEELWEDFEALQAIMDMDNENADIEMAVDEIQAQGRIDQMILRASDKMEPPKNPKNVTLEMVMQEFEDSTIKRSFNQEQFQNFVQFRLSISSPIAVCFRTCVFHAVCGRVRVQPKDYGCVASLDVRAMWLKVAILVRQYMATMAEKFPNKFTASDFMGRPASCKAPMLKPSMIKVLVGVEWVLWPNHFSLHHAHCHNRHPYTYVRIYVRTYMLTLMSAWT